MYPITFVIFLAAVSGGSILRLSAKLQSRKPAPLYHQVIGSPIKPSKDMVVAITRFGIHLSFASKDSMIEGWSLF